MTTQIDRKDELKAIIEGIIDGNQSILTCKRLSRRANISTVEAEKVLSSYWLEHKGSVFASFVYSGVDQQGKRKLLLVNETQQPLLSQVFSKSIYSISRFPVIEPTLICSDDLQEDRVLVLISPSDRNDLRDNRFSVIRSTAVQHRDWCFEDVNVPMNMEERVKEQQALSSNTSHIESFDKNHSVETNEIEQEEEDEPLVVRRRRKTTRVDNLSNDDCHSMSLPESIEMDVDQSQSNLEQENLAMKKKSVEDKKEDNILHFTQNSVKHHNIQAPKKKCIRTTCIGKGTWVIDTTIPENKQEKTAECLKEEIAEEEEMQRKPQDETVEKETLKPNNTTKKTSSRSVLSNRNSFHQQKNESVPQRQQPSIFSFFGKQN